MKRRVRSNPIRALRRAAFTLFELLVVIVVILALIAVTVPSFATLIESANFSSAVNAVTGTLGNARALAISSSKPVGVAFLFDTVEEEYTLQVVELVRDGTKASLTQQVPSSGAPDAAAWGLRPAVNTTPVTLPTGFGVFGMSFAHTRGPEESLQGEDWLDLIPTDPPTAPWYAGETFTDPNNANWTVNPWIFPRNDPRLFLDPDDLDAAKRAQGLTLDEVWRIIHGDPVPGVSFTDADAELAVRHANSFVVMYDAGGTIISVYDGGATTPDRDFYLEFPDEPLDPTAGLTIEERVQDSDFTFDPERIRPNIQEPSPNPEVWLRSVNQLAIVSFQRLSGGTQIDRPWELHPSTSQAPWPDFRGSAQYQSAPLDPANDEIDDLVIAVTRWIDQNAEIIGFDRYSGAAQRRSDLQ